MFNESVMVALIEEEYVRRELNTDDTRDKPYIKFLQALMQATSKTKVQAACCR